MRTRDRAIILTLSLLLAASLACNGPRIIIQPAATATPFAPQQNPTAIPAQPTATDTSEPPPPTTEAPQESPEPTEAPTDAPPTDEPATDTPTPEPTDTSSPPTDTPIPATDTAEPTETPDQGDPLQLQGQGYEIIESNAIGTEGEWEGYLRINFSGGVAPYEFAMETGDPQSENRFYIHWGNCNAPLTVHVWSADGQELHESVWVQSPHCS